MAVKIKARKKNRFVYIIDCFDYFAILYMFVQKKKLFIIIT